MTNADNILEEQLGTASYLATQLVRKVADRNRARGRRQRMKKAEAVEVIHAILRYMVVKGIDS
jgi:hypothetical protein